MFMNLFAWKCICIILVVNDRLCDTTPASPHIHTHHHEEREANGGYSPRDKSHMVNGQHHTEFDHEAILGLHCSIYIFNFNRANNAIDSYLEGSRCDSRVVS
jgi:hypothetical protein